MKNYLISNSFGVILRAKQILVLLIKLINKLSHNTYFIKIQKLWHRFEKLPSFYPLALLLVATVLFGRFLVNDAVVIISSVKGIKENALKKWVVIDIGTNYLIPAPGKNFKVFPLIKRKPDNKQKSHIVDAICSPAGIIQEDNSFGPYKIGEKIAVCNSGAYTSVMKEQFIFEDPKHLFLKEGMVVETIDKFKLNDVLRYHGWKIKCN